MANKVDYVLVGVNIGYGNITPSEHERLMNTYEDGYYQIIPRTSGKYHLTMISDVMNSQYIFFGYVIAKSIDDDGLGIIDIDSLSKDDRQNVSQGILEETGIKGDAHVYVFTHWH